MKIYIDSEYRCHAINSNGDFQEIETDFFDGKCATFIEGYCYDDSKGYVQIYPWKPHYQLDNAQREYERALLTQKDEIIAELDAALLETQYNMLINNF